MRPVTLAMIVVAGSAIAFPATAQQAAPSQLTKEQMDKGLKTSEPPTSAQPERSPQQSEQSREQDRKSAEDVQLGRDWKVQRRDGDRMERMGRMEQEGSDRRTAGRNWRMQRDDDERAYYDEDRPRRRVKICTEYENGDEFCRYRN